MIRLIIGKKKELPQAQVDEASGDSKELVSINMDFLKKKKPAGASQNPRDYYQNLNAAAALGIDERFPKFVIDYIEKLPAKYLPESGKKYFVKWLANEIKRAGEGREPSYDQVALAKQAFDANGNKELNGTLETIAAGGAKLAGKEIIKGGYKTNDVIHTFNNGWKIVRLAKSSGTKADVDHDMGLEGEKMSNCVGEEHCTTVLLNRETVYSLRDPNNKPHVDMNIKGDSYRRGSPPKIEQIFGRANSNPKKEHLDMLVPWIMSNFAPAEFIEIEWVTTHPYFTENFDFVKYLNGLTIKELTDGEFVASFRFIIEGIKDGDKLDSILDAIIAISKRPEVAGILKKLRGKKDQFGIYTDNIPGVNLFTIFIDNPRISGDLLLKAYNELAKPEFLAAKGKSAHGYLEALLLSGKKIPKQLFADMAKLVESSNDKELASNLLANTHFPSELKANIIASESLPVDEYPLVVSIIGTIRKAIADGKPLPKEIVERFLVKASRWGQGTNKKNFQNIKKEILSAYEAEEKPSKKLAVKSTTKKQLQEIIISETLAVLEEAGLVFNE